MVLMSINQYMTQFWLFWSMGTKPSCLPVSCPAGRGKSSGSFLNISRNKSILPLPPLKLIYLMNLGVVLWQPSYFCPPIRSMRTSITNILDNCRRNLFHLESWRLNFPRRWSIFSVSQKKTKKKKKHPLVLPLNSNAAFLGILLVLEVKWCHMLFLRWKWRMGRLHTAPSVTVT